MVDSQTRPEGKQILFRSSKTGEWTLDAYLENSEIGNKTLQELLLQLFDVNGAPSITNLATWKGDWVTATLYNASDIFKVNVSGQQKIYVATQQHTSTNIAADLAANKISLVIDNTFDVMSAVGLPSLTGQALKLIRINAAATAFEYLTAAALVTALGVPTLSGLNTFTNAILQLRPPSGAGIFQTVSNDTTVGNKGSYEFYSRNTTPVDILMAIIGIDVTSVTPAAETAYLFFGTRKLGSVLRRFQINEGFSAATLGDKGPGTINATEYYKNDAIFNPMPVGIVSDFAGSAAPTGWLMCFGQNVSRATYSALFTAIGVVYGAGNGTTTFTLPDCRGRVVAGVDNMGGSSSNRMTAPINGDNLGAAGGAESHTIVAAEVPDNVSDNLGATSAGLPGRAIKDHTGSAVSAMTIVQPTIMMNKMIFAGV